MLTFKVSNQKCKTMNDTTQALQVIHDTLYIKGYENVDLINRVDLMYNNAWNKLMYFWTALAIFIPAIILWFQNRKLKISRSELQEQITESNFFHKIMEGNLAHFQAEYSRTVKDNFKQAAIDYIKAAKYFAEGKSLENSENALRAFLHVVKYEPNDAWRVKDVDRIDIGRSRDIRKDLNTLRRKGDLSILKLLEDIETCLQ